MKNLKTVVEERLAALKGKYGVYYKNLISGESLLHTQGETPPSEMFQTEGDQFLSASVIKLFVMAEAYRQMEAGEINHGDCIALREEDKLPSGAMPDYAGDEKKGKLTDELFPESGILNYIHTGAEFTLQDLIRLMIVISDNSSTNMLIKRLGADNINKSIQSLHMEKTKLNRLLFDSDPRVKGLENTISLQETGLFLEKIYRKELISEKASMEMSAILQNQQFNYKIPFFINHLPIAHKTGEDSSITNDVGIIFGENPFIFCFAANYADVPTADRACQDLAREAYYYTLGIGTKDIRIQA